MYLLHCSAVVPSSTRMLMRIIVAELNAPYKVATFGTILPVSEPPVRTAAGSLRAELAALCPVSGQMYSK